jgi:HPt (histidine-containing phosphotransfer) domain-containing protein
VDVESGLKTWQNPEAYRKALFSFSENYSQVCAELSRLIDRHDQKTAHHLVHTLKGVAGNLSMKGVFEAASVINNAIKAENFKLAREMIGKLSQSMQVVVTSIQGMQEIKNDKKGHFQENLDISEATPLFEKIMVAFEKYNPDMVVPHLKKLRPYFSERQIQPIFKNLDEFNFAEAKKKVKELAHKIGLDMEA